MNKINKSSPNELRIAFSLGSIIDIKKSKSIYNESGFDAFRDVLNEHKLKNSIFAPGPSLGLFMALRKLNNSVPDEVLKIKFCLVSRIDPNPSLHSVIMDSMDHYMNENKEKGDHKYGFDLIALTGGEDIYPFLSKDVFAADIFFTTTNENAKDLFIKGINCIHIPNKSKENNIELYKKRNGEIVIFSDFDGVLGDASSEEIYQRSIRENKEPLKEFLDFEEENKNIPMSLGPLGETIKKLSRVVKYQKENNTPINELSLKITIITARNGQTLSRFNKTIELNDIEISQLYMMEGQNKNFLLGVLAEINKGKNLLFVDDSEIHFKRSSELLSITSGWVPNYVNTPSLDKVDED